MRFSFIIFSLLLPVSAYTQELVPAYQIFDSVCLDQNPSLRDIRAAFEFARSKELEQKDALLTQSLSPVEIEIEPNQPTEWNKLRLKLEPKSSGWTGIVEIETYENGELVTYRMEKNRVVELMWKFQEILQQSAAWDVEALYLASVKPGVYSPSMGFRQLPARQQALPREAGDIQLKVINPVNGESAAWDLSQSLLENYIKLQETENSFARSEINPDQCVLLSCRNQTESFNTQDKKFQKLIEDYNFFINHIHVLLKQALPSSSPQTP